MGRSVDASPFIARSSRLHLMLVTHTGAMLGKMNLCSEPPGMSLPLVNNNNQAGLLLTSSTLACFLSNEVSITEMALGNKM